MKDPAIVAIEKEISDLLPKVLDGRMEMSDAKQVLDNTARRVLKGVAVEVRQDALGVAHKAANIGEGFFAQIQEAITSVTKK